MNITKIKLKNELNLESVDAVTKAQQQLNHFNIEDFFLDPAEATAIRRYFQ